MAAEPLNSQDPEFSLLGGPLHRLAGRLGLVRRRTNTVLIGVVLGVGPWLVGVLLAAIEGDLPRLFALEGIGAHVRMLVAIPLFFVCESMLAPQLERFARYCMSSGMLSADSQRSFKADLARAARWNAHWLPEAICVAAAVLVAIMAPAKPWGGITSTLDEEYAVSLAGWWYWIVGLSLFRFLMFRWIWRYTLWCYLLWRLSRLPLRLMPAHPDGHGGLGVLGEVHAHLLPLIVALSAVLSASFAEDIGTGRSPFEALHLAVIAMLLVAALIVLGPLAVFVGKLWACRQRGVEDYLGLGAHYTASFDQKWFGSGAAANAPELGSADIQALADLATAVRIVRNMRLFPAGRRLLLGLVAATVVPLLPLLTLRYPLSDIIDQLLNRLVGL